MQKYKQTIIPEFSIPKEWTTKNSKELRELLFESLKSIHGKIIVNKDINIKVEISVKGIRKTTHGGAMYSKKAALAMCLPELIKYAEYNNFGNRKENDATAVIGYLNFKASIIDGKKENAHLVVQFQKGGKFHYSIEANKIIGTPEVP